MILMYLCFCNNYGGLGLYNNYGGLYLCNYYGGLVAKSIIIVAVIVLDFSVIDLLCY